MTLNEANDVKWLLFPCAQYSRLSKQYGMEIYLKKEHLHYTGSVAERGALYLLTCLTQVSRRRTHRHTHTHTRMRLDLRRPPEAEIVWVQWLLLTGDERWERFWSTAPSVPSAFSLFVCRENNKWGKINSKWMWECLSFRFEIKVKIWLVDYNTNINNHASHTLTIFNHTPHSKCLCMT